VPHFPLGVIYLELNAQMKTTKSSIEVKKKNYGGHAGKTTD